MVESSGSDRDDSEPHPAGMGVKERVKISEYVLTQYQKGELLPIALDRRRCWSGGPPTTVDYVAQDCVWPQEMYKHFLNADPRPTGDMRE